MTRLVVAVAFSAMLGVLTAPGAQAQDWNESVLAAIRKMPVGGGYAVTSEAGRNFREAVAVDRGRLRVNARSAVPSYCSSATYLLLLEVINDAARQRAVGLDDAALTALAPRPAQDGHGIWGRWNAHGPGAAMLFHELGVGENFTAIDAARPGDFLKIFWRDAVGKSERGHLVVYLGRERREDGEWVRFWSSNQPDGYGDKWVHESKIARMLFSRLTDPSGFAHAAEIPRVQPYLASLLDTESSFAEATQRVGASDRP